MNNSFSIRVFGIVTLALTLVACVPEPLDPDAPPCSACEGRGVIPMVRTTTYGDGTKHQEYFNAPCGFCGHSGRSDYAKVEKAETMNLFIRGAVRYMLSH